MSLFTFYTVLQSSEILDSFSLENPERMSHLNSYFYSTLNFKEKQKLDTKMSAMVISFFQNRYGIQDQAAFQKVWKEIGAKIWTPNLCMTAGILRQIDQAFQQQLVYHGSGMLTSSSREENIHKVVHQTVKTLLHGESFPVTDLLDTRVLKAVLVNKDTEFLNQMRNELQEELNNLADHPPQTKEEEFAWRIYLGNILSLLPFTYPSDQEKIVIPVLNESGECSKVEYCIEVILLTPETESTSMKALGLTPKTDKERPVLVFSGTTYPAGDGFSDCVMADFTPGQSVGKKPYNQGQGNIDQWIKGKKDVHVLGVSLGGALSLQAVRYHHEHLGRVDAYNPPGLYPWDWKKEYNEGCEINIYCQAGDSVSPMGAWPTGEKVSVYRLLSHQEGFSEGPLISHITAYMGHKKVTVLSKDPKEVNKDLLRKTLTGLHLLFSPLVYLSAYSMLKLYSLVLVISYVFYQIINRLNTCVKTSVSKLKRKKPTY